MIHSLSFPVLLVIHSVRIQALTPRQGKHNVREATNPSLTWAVVAYLNTRKVSPAYITPVDTILACKSTWEWLDLVRLQSTCCVSLFVTLAR